MQGYMTPEQAAEHLNIGVQALRTSRRTGKLGDLPAPPFIPISQRVSRYTEKALDKWVQMHNFWGENESE